LQKGWFNLADFGFYAQPTEATAGVAAGLLRLGGVAEHAAMSLARATPGDVRVDVNSLRDIYRAQPSVILAAVNVAVGIPLIAIGVATERQWKEEHVQDDPTARNKRGSQSLLLSYSLPLLSVDF
jgi:hypothetical protein